MTLSHEEKDDLLAIIEIIYGYDSQIRNYKSSFNDATVLVVEEALAALTQCNEDMKALVVDLVGGAREPTNNSQTPQAYKSVQVEATITGLLVACRKSLTKKLDRSVSPEGWALNRLPALSGSLERTRHSTALPFVH